MHFVFDLAKRRFGMGSSPLFDLRQNLLTERLPMMVLFLVHFLPPLCDGLILASFSHPVYPLCKKMTGATMPPHDLPERNPHVILLLLLNKDLEEHREAWSVKVSCVCYTHERQTSDISSQTGPGAFLVVKTGEM